MSSLPKSESYASIDMDAVKEFNSRNNGTNFEIQIKRGAKAGAGDIVNAKVLLLYANPGHNPKIDKQTPIDIKIPGWPLAALHPDFANHHPGAHRWLTSRLRHLTERYGAQFISQNVASINIVPWASTQYKPMPNLPSRDIQLNLARQAADRGAILVAVRARTAWAPLLEEYPDQVILTSNPRSSYISPANLGRENWERIIRQLDLSVEK